MTTTSTAPPSGPVTDARTDAATEGATGQPGGEILTASPRAALRRRAVVIVMVAVVLIVVILIVVARGAAPASRDTLSATNPAPDGAMALVQVLEQHGVHVIPTDSVKATRKALAGIDSRDATIMVYDPEGLMSPEQRGAVLSLGTDVVAVEPDLLALPDLAPGVGLTGELRGTFRADCPVEAVQNAAVVSASGIGYRITADKDGVETAEGAARDAVTCLTKKGASGLVQLPRGGQTLSLLGLASALQNDTIATQGDAALALNLFGAHRTLVWYISTYADLQQAAAPSLADLTPGWATPLALLLLIAVVAAGVWRGRRFGPIVVENLPVVVRASETMEGRARLYSRARARLRAIDAIRIGTVERLAKAVGLPRTATVSEVADAAAALVGRDREGVSALLLDVVPLNDAELVRLSDELLALEDEVAAARPGSSLAHPTASPENGHHG